MRDEDLSWHAWPAVTRSPGGQHITRTETGVLLVHVPTGIAVVKTSERSLLQNRKRALAQLRDLLELSGYTEPPCPGS